MTNRRPMIFDSSLGIFRKAGEGDEMLSQGGYLLGNDASDVVSITSSGTVLTAAGALTLQDSLVVNGTGNITGNTTIGGILTTGGAGYAIQFATTSGIIGVSNDTDLIQLDGTIGITINNDLFFGANTISGTGDIHAGAFYGDGSNLTGIAGGTPAVDDVGIEYDSQLELKDNIIILSHDTAQGAAGGSTGTNNVWVTTPLNTEVYDPNGWCTISSNQFTLVAGTYRIRVLRSFYQCGDGKIRLRNISDSTDITHSTINTSTGTGVSTWCPMTAVFAISGSKTFAVQLNSSAGASNGSAFGYAANVSGYGERYALVEIERIK